MFANFTDIQWIRNLDLLVFAVLQIDHSFQQSKGLFLKRIREKYSTANYKVLKKSIDALKWGVVALVVLTYASKNFYLVEDVLSGRLLKIYFTAVAALFLPIFIFYIWKKNLMIKIFSLRFVVLIFSTLLIKLRGFYHGTEYLTIIAKINQRYFSGLNYFKNLIFLQVAAFILMSLIATWAYMPLIPGFDAGLYIFPFLKILTTVHFVLDHYMYTQRYIPAQKITAIL